MKGTIEIKGLEKTFTTGDDKQIPVLKDVNLTIKGGQFACLVGPSGCGKTTILHAIAGIIEKDRGSILIDGMDHLRARFGYVFQEARLLNWRTAAQNVEFGAVAAEIPQQEIPGLVRRYIDLVGLSDFANSYPLTLSGGMQQRVAIARGLAHDPSFLLMDEPFAALDALTRENMMIELQRIWMSSAKSVLFITHSIPEAVFLSDRILVLSNRPGTVVHEMKVPLPRPRTLDSMGDPAFNDCTRELRQIFNRL